MKLSEILKKAQEMAGDNADKPFLRENNIKFRIEHAAEENRTPGKLPYYDCPECLNRGYRVYVDPTTGEMTHRECRCMAIRASKRRLIQSGLADMAERYTFDNWQTVYPWQIRAKEICEAYVRNKKGWLLLAGSVGAGKSHLCTAVCVQLINEGIDTRYMLWRDVVTRAKSLVTDPEQYRELIEPLKTVRALYIDDFFKTGKGGEPTEADVNFAFELLNARYLDAKKLTIISTERMPRELITIDEAVGTRIVERSKGYRIALENKENWRLR